MADYSDTAIRARVYQAQYDAYQTRRAKLMEDRLPLVNADAALKANEAEVSAVDQKISELETLAKTDGVTLAVA